MSQAHNTNLIHYSLSIPELHTHYVKVDLEIVVPNKKEVQLSMPVWTPGSYLIREFSKKMECYEATASGKLLLVTKTNKNTNISYYAKGLIVAALLDAKISMAKIGKKNLDDLMRVLWKQYYTEKQRGFAVAEFEAAASEVAKTDFKNFFDKHVRSLETSDYQGILSDAVLTINIKTDKRRISGINASAENVKKVVKFLESGTTACNSGVNVNDELIALNGLPVNNDTDDFMKKLSYPEKSKLLISRGGIVREIDFVFSATGRFSPSLGFEKEKNYLPLRDGWEKLIDNGRSTD